MSPNVASGHVGRSRRARARSLPVPGSFSAPRRRRPRTALLAGAMPALRDTCHAQGGFTALATCFLSAVYRVYGGNVAARMAAWETPFLLLTSRRLGDFLLFGFIVYKGAMPPRMLRSCISPCICTKSLQLSDYRPRSPAWAVLFWFVVFPRAAVAYWRTGFFASLRCNVRRCMLSARAVAEILPLFSASARWICSHSSRATESSVGCSIASSAVCSLASS